MTTAGGVLAISVTLLGPKFQLATFPKGSTPPAWAQALITNPKAWRSAPESASTPEGEDEDPSQEDASPATGEASPADAPEANEPVVEDLVGELPEPPKRGAGSGREPWAVYARSKGITVTDDMNRDEIIDAVEAAE